ncbi:MAG: hypothetical protein PHF63_03870 [Herbinix sp.]|nr:hypothetical protein [Herbinix sp.]
MSVNGITNATQAYDSNSTAKAKAKSDQNLQTEDTNQKDTNTAVVYEKSEPSTETKKIYKQDTATIERLKAQADKRTQSLRSLVEKMLTKQGQIYTDSTDIYAVLREGKVDIDPETRAQAQKDVAEDGYWGVEQTSERILSFAKALAGGDYSKADELIAAVKKGFEEATKTWGDELPDLSKRTLEATINKLESWRDGKDSGSSASSMTAKTITSQAASKTIAE